MPLIVNTNIASLEAQRNMAFTQRSLEGSFQRLSSGFRINSAADDAAGLAISESMNMQVRGFMVAERNANNAISMSQVAEGALGQITAIVARMRDLAVQASNGDLTSTDRGYLNTEFSQLRSEIDRMASATKFNNRDLLSGSLNTIDFQVGVNNVTTDGSSRIQVNFGALAITDLALTTVSLDGGTNANAQASITALDTAMTTINTRRENFGAAINRLQMTISHTQSMKVNLTAAVSRIRDADVAEETAQLARSQVLAQAGTAILAQANQAPNLALSLLQR